ncbi:hypothetical protein [Microbulbifer epialgicus]|uniref:Uncharacterized protein n=1 Tax=Microbulbifer epialgicus TaxID=393907 RepID=A0ABV4NUR1_9GAMM
MEDEGAQKTLKGFFLYAGRSSFYSHLYSVAGCFAGYGFREVALRVMKNG